MTDDDNVIELPLVTRKQFELAADQMERQVIALEQILDGLRESIRGIREDIRANWGDE